MNSVPARRLTPGSGRGTVFKLATPLSLWGGIDLETGVIIDAAHPQRGLTVAGRILAMPAARGSSSSSSTLVEAARRGTAPAAIILGVVDPIIVVGSLIAADLYGIQVPVLVIEREHWVTLVNGAQADIRDDDKEVFRFFTPTATGSA